VIGPAPSPEPAHKPTHAQPPSPLPARPAVSQWEMRSQFLHKKVSGRQPLILCPHCTPSCHGQREAPKLQAWSINEIRVPSQHDSPSCADGWQILEIIETMPQNFSCCLRGDRSKLRFLQTNELWIESCSNIFEPEYCDESQGWRNLTEGRQQSPDRACNRSSSEWPSRFWNDHPSDSSQLKHCCPAQVTQSLI
jgi:hypothetical protein